MRSLLILIALAACGGSKPAPTTSTTSSAPSDVGSPVSPTASGSDAPNNIGLGCEKEIQLRCAQGNDGCDGGRTIVHACIPTDAKAGPPCEQEIALVCGDGQIDGCLKTPQVSKNHVCVYK